MLLNSPSVVHAHACFHTHMHPCTQTQRVGSPRDQVGGAAAKGGAGEEKKRRQKDGQRGRQRVRGEEENGPLSQQVVQSCQAMSPCHRHGNTEPADSFGLIGSCQGNDKINAVFDGNIERWA